MESEIRLEDLGKMMLKDAPILETKVIKETLSNYFQDSKNAIYLLYGRANNYFTVFRNNSFLGAGTADKFIEFTNESSFYVVAGELASEYGMNEIVEIEYNKNINAVELWIGEGNPQYFQLMAWDDSTVQI